MEATGRVSAPLVLLIDEDPTTGNVLRPLVRPHGLEVVQARASVAALELLQRVGRRFRLVVISLEMAGLSGAVVLETLRLFRPELATICLAAASSAAGVRGGCLIKPASADELRGRIADALAGAPARIPAASLPPEVIAKARQALERSGNLMAAAREIELGMSDQSAFEA
jgi:DNA-binding response OmpR family regulator